MHGIGGSVWCWARRPPGESRRDRRSVGSGAIHLRRYFAGQQVSEKIDYPTQNTARPARMGRDGRQEMSPASPTEMSLWRAVVEALAAP